MERIRTIWSRGLVGKILLIAAGGVGVLALCCVLLVAFVPRSPQSAQAGATAAPAAAARSTSAPQPTEERAATAGPTNAPAPTKTPAPTSTPQPTIAPPPTATPEPTLTPEPTATSAPTITPKPTAAPVVVADLAVTKHPGTVSAGQIASVTVRTRPGETCDISVIYKSGASTAQGLYPKQASQKGLVSWSWKVGTRTTPGSWPVLITCGDQSVRTEVAVR